MKILLIIDNLGSGGAQRQMVSLATGLKKLGHHVILFTYYPQDFFLPELKACGIEVLLIPKKGRLGLGVVARLMRLMWKGRFDICLSFLDTPNLYNLLGSVFSRGARHLTSERSSTNFTRENTRLQYWIHRKADFLVCNSHHERNGWCARYPELGAKSTVIYNGVSQVFFDVQFQRPVASRPLKILAIGTVSPYKNTLCLVNALKLLNDQSIAAQVHWYGRQDSGPFYAAYVTEVKNTIAQLHLQDRWVWEQPVSQLQNIIPEFDCLVIPSVVEGFPNVLCEGLATGIPVFVNNVLDHPLLVKDGVNGFLFDGSNPRSLVNKIKAFTQIDDVRKTAMSEMARDTARHQLQEQRMVGAYEQLFGKLINA